MQGINDDNILDTMPMLQDLEVDLILTCLEISKKVSILQSPDIWIANTGASNDSTAHNKDIINLRKDESA